VNKSTVPKIEPAPIRASATTKLNRKDLVPERAPGRVGDKVSTITTIDAEFVRPAF
jgi:hypothetical protein